MTKRPGYRRFCSLAAGLDIVGERWTLVIVQELLHRPLRYSELRGLLPGIGSNVLAERLRTLEQQSLVERRTGSLGTGVLYVLTQRGVALGPALALFRQWAIDELLPPNPDPNEKRVYDLSYAVGVNDGLDESYEWRIGEDVYALVITGTRLTVSAGRARRPVVTLRTTREFMHRWVAGATTWNQGRTDGEVHVTGSHAAWVRMLHATGYPGR